MPLPQSNRYTYADYLTWKTEDKYELFDGTPVMQARPNIQHQRISAALMHQLMAALDGNPCQALAEIEVLLPDYPHQNVSDIRNVYVPDIVVVCDPEKLSDHYCIGAPTLVIEILSPSTAKADRLVKLNKYQQSGVSEYWIVSPQEQNITVFVLDNGLFRTAAVYNADDADARILSLKGIVLDLSKVL